MSIPVVAAILRDQHGNFLCCQRHSKDVHPGLWEFPGGKIEPGEDVINAMHRELHEELNLDLPRDLEVREVRVVDWDYGTKVVRLHFVAVALHQRPEIRLQVHQQAEWLTTDQMHHLDWIESNRSIVDYLDQDGH